MLSPNFHEVQGIIVWDKHVADRIQEVELIRQHRITD